MNSTTSKEADTGRSTLEALAQRLSDLGRRCKAAEAQAARLKAAHESARGTRKAKS